MDDDDPGIYSEAGPPAGARVFGRLRARLAFWQLFASALVVSWLHSGYPLEFTDGIPPPARVGRNHASAAQEAAFVSAAIADLLASGAAVAVATAPTVVSPLGVATRALPIGTSTRLGNVRRRLRIEGTSPTRQQRCI